MLRKKIYLALVSDRIERFFMRGALYHCVTTREEIQTHQIEKFNRIWKDAYTNLPFYKKWKEEHGLPDTITIVGELFKWPIITKKMLQFDPGALIRKDSSHFGTMMTGGSTGEPLRLRTWKDNETGVSQWLGRAGYGVTACERTFLLWGHTHLYGKGLKRHINMARRRILDYFSNYDRHSAFDLSKPAMQAALVRYNKCKPHFVIGYSSAILALCRINRLLGNKAIIPPQAVLCTASSLTSLEKTEISDFFSAPVCMEYGSMECAVMAHTIPQTGEYRVFWDTHLLQGQKDELGEVRNIVTRLESCYVPFIRYDLGDYLELSNTEPLDSIHNIQTIKGRTSEVIALKNGVSFFCSIIGHCVKQIPFLVSWQLFVFESELRIDVVGDGVLSEDDKRLILSRLHAVVKGSDACHVQVRQVGHLYVTQAGKTPLVVRGQK